MTQLDLGLDLEPDADGVSAQALMAFLLRMRARGISDVAVLRALETVPRELFVPHRYRDLALRDIAMPIGCGQTMPEPWLVARMMEGLDLGPRHRVLEIGCGSGYATAILAKLVHEVVSFEIFEALAVECAARMATLGLDNVRVVHADAIERLGSLGLFDRILVHAVVEGRPAGLFECLAESGIIVLARREGLGRATLVRITHASGETFHETPLCPCRLGGLIAFPGAD